MPGMKIDWQRVRLLIWLRKRQVHHATARHRSGGGFQNALIYLFAVVAFLGGLAAGFYMLSESNSSTLIGWDFWAAFACYLWLAGLAAEAQRADPIDAGRLLHLPISLREAFLLNFVASFYNMANIVGFAGALGLAGGQALHRPVMLFMIPLAAMFLLTVTAWAQVLRAWFLKVFSNPRRRRWLSIVAGLILALAAQLPNLVNVLRMNLSDRYSEAVFENGAEEEAYDPLWATLPPGMTFDSDNLTVGADSARPRHYVMPDKREVFRVTYTPALAPSQLGVGDVLRDFNHEVGLSAPSDMLFSSYWKVSYWQVEGGVWRRAPAPPGQMTGLFVNGAGSYPGWDSHARATENLDGVPVDLRDLLPPRDYTRIGVRPNPKLKSGALTAHAFVPLGWPAWIAVNGLNGWLTMPLIAGLGGFALITALGMRRAWSIHRQAVLMTENLRSAPKSAAPAKPPAPVRDTVGSLTKPLWRCGPEVSCLARTFLRHWGRSVEVRFQIIIACALAGGAVAAGIFLRIAGAGPVGAVQIICSMTGLVMLGFMGLFINQFGYDRGGCRALILAPASARTVLMAKNAALMRLVLFTSLPFGVAAALLSGEWLACLLTWTLVTPAAVLFTLALGNGSSVANPVPARLGQRAQARPDGNQLGNGCLHLILYMLIVLILQVPQFVAGFTGAAWSGYVAALAVLALGFWIWKANLRVHSRALSHRFGEVADSVGKATDM